MTSLLKTRGIALALVLTALALAPAPASAGCLSEYRTCADCAKKSLRRATLHFDARGIVAANGDLWDCSLDLNHCIFFGQHHDYGCAR